MKFVVALVAALTLNAVANLMMKFGVNRLKADLAAGSGPIPALLTNWVLILGLIFFASNVVLYTFALSGIKISVAYPIMVSGGFVIISVVAWKYLHERLSHAQWAGVALILVGVWLVAREMTTTPQQAPTASAFPVAQTSNPA